MDRQAKREMMMNYPPRLVTQKSQNPYESGANPDFTVTSATRYERELALTMKKLTMKTDLLDKKLMAVDELANKKGEKLIEEQRAKEKEAAERLAANEALLKAEQEAEAATKEIAE